MTEITNSYHHKAADAHAMPTDAKGLTGAGITAPQEAKGAVYHTGHTPPGGETALLLNILRCLAPQSSGDKTFADTEARMNALSNAFAGLGLPPAAREIATGKLLQASELRQAMMTAFDKPQADVTALAACQQRLAEVVTEATSEISSDLRNNALTARRAEVQTKAKLELEAKQAKKSEISTSTSYADLWQVLAEAVGSIKNDYVDEYARLMKAYADMYQAYNETVQNAAGEAIGSGNESSKVEIDPRILNKAYEAFREKRHEIEKSLGYVKGWEHMDDVAKQHWITTMAPAFELEINGKISLNMSQYDNSADYPAGVEATVWRRMPPTWEFVELDADPQDVSTATYQAWLASFNAVGTGLQSNMQSFAQRYSQANSTFDNLNKVLSGAISALADSAKEVFRNLS
ncbi:IpaD/SipD/SspD family type III secretion system needle tip protein [Erwinia sp. E602]|uniref:IpaD/SipD/SspD family type III secretion system needle tip protein n=1 Tax=Erwinia sp. E602 TaxID=2675378 RepID=UPI001BA79C5B|nr:IpaD/SipD/SspD family type III secretion system needle tip protein [Erwinia sp. E602]QUG74596.1 IpaD/SipD/SspD family type III secretion system needle tip protein [Erwinia sp. E602]